MQLYRHRGNVIENNAINFNKYDDITNANKVMNIKLWENK